MPSRARVEANRWLKQHAAMVQGRVLSIGSRDDQDGQGDVYRHYFSNCMSYVTSEVVPEFGCDLVLDVRSMPQVENESFDCVFCSAVLEHVDDFHAALAEITRILKPNGTLLLGLPFRQAIHLSPQDFWRFTEYGITWLLKKYGYYLNDLTAIDTSVPDFPAAYLAKATKTAHLKPTIKQQEHPIISSSATSHKARRLDLIEPPGHVHIVIADEGWILERCAREIEVRLDYVTISQTPDSQADANYYINYSAFRERNSPHEIGFFTHIEERVPAAAQRFFEVARQMDACVAMSARYAEALRRANIDNVRVITPGVDLEAFQPKIKIGVVGRTYPTGRKGEDLLQAVSDEPGIEWHFTGTGWPGPAKFYRPDEMPDFYHSIDYILIPAYYEGGPLSILEALACGKEVIAPPVGFVSDYPHIEFAIGDSNDLRRVLRQLIAKRKALHQAVQHRTWDAWADAHDHLFRQLLGNRPRSHHSNRVSSETRLMPPAPRQRPKRVLLALHSPENRGPGGPTIRIQQTKKYLEQIGIEATVSTEDFPDASGYDLIHMFNVWEPHAALAQLRYFRRFNVPLVFSPIYLDLSEFAWAARAIPSVFHQAQSPQELDQYLTAIANSKLEADGISRFDRNEIIEGYFDLLAKLIKGADHLIALSEFEMERLWSIGIEPRPYTLVHNAADVARFGRVSGDLFAKTYGVSNYVLCVGRIERRKNQLMLAHALRDTNLPLVFIGQPTEPDYAELIKQHAGPNTIFIDRLPPDSDLLASAYAGACVFTLPSWSEGAPLSALEAAAAGIPLVLSDRSAEREYFGELALYCDPGNIKSIRKAVLHAYKKQAPETEHRHRLQTLVREQYNWTNVAQATAQAYEQAIAAFRPRPFEQNLGPKSVASQPPSQRKLEIGSGHTPQPGYEHLDVRADLPDIDHVHDINQPLPFDEGTFDEILTRSCVEHISWRNSTAMLRDWRHVLKPGGKLEIWMPDFEYLCRMYLDGQLDQHLDPSYIEQAGELLGGYTPAAWAMIKMFAGQEYPENFHTAVYDFETIKRVLELAGYERIQRQPPYHGLHVIAYRPQIDPPAFFRSGSGQESQISTNSSTSLPSILWRGPIFDFSGYAFLSRQTILALDNHQVQLQADSFTMHPKFEELFKINRAEFDIWHRLSNTRVDSGLHICVHPPVVWNGTDVFAAYRQKSPNSKAHVGVTMFETDRMPSGWAAACNNMDEIWVPSTFNRETFAKAGVDSHRLQVIPFGLDTAIYDPDKVGALDIPDAKGFVFLSVFQWNKRKGWDVLLKAYLSAFTAKDDVCLVLRTYPDQQKTPSIGQRIKRYIRKLGYKPGTTPSIILLDNFVPENQMPTLYAAANAFVLPTRGEGWGIPFMEAMAMALPVIGTRWSAHLDFMNDDNSYLINIEGLRPIDREQTQENPYYQPDHHWAEPSVGHTAELMRQVYDNRDEARTKGQQARRDIQTNWSLNRTVEWIIERSTHLSQPTDTQTNPRIAERSPLTNTPSLPLLWHAPIFDPSGYADEARNFILQLHAQGFDIAANAIGRHSETFRSQLDPHKQQVLELILAQQPSAKFINLIHFPAYIFQRLPQAAYNIGRVMFETDGLPAEWVAKCNQMDEIWVPTDFNLQTFKAAGVTAKLVKVPGGIDTDQFQPGYDPLLIPGIQGTVFLSVFEWIYRKGWDVLLRAWAEAFAPADDVCLVLRTYPINTTDVPDTKQVIEDHINRFLQTELNLSRNEIAPIIVLAEQIPEEDLPRLYAAATAYVAPSRGEGWGRPHMQAMACGLPVIATNWGGNLEFMNKQNSLLIDIEGLTEIDERAEIPFYRGQRWAEPSVAHLVSHLQYVHRHPTEAAAIGQQAHRDMLEHWQWHKAANMAIERLHTIQMELSPIGQVPNLAPTAPPATNGSQPHPEERQIASEKSINLRWEGSQFVHHSLALINREFCLRLAQHQPIDLSIIPYEPDQFDSHIDPRFEHITRNLNRSLARPADVHVRHQWPPNFTPPAEGRWVMIQPWEFGSIPKHWNEIMREKVDEVWAYTNYVRDCYIRSGLPAHKVHVVPPGVDTAKFHPDAPPLALKTKKRFKFLFVGGTIARKGIDILLDAYISSFTANDDVCLVIKDMGGRSFYKGQTAQETIVQIQTDPNAPEIEYIDRILDDTQLAGLYTAATCLVHPYRGEGFGLPIAEAMACGLPVIVTGHGAALDFCSPETAYLIPAREVRLPEKRIGDNETVDYPWWADPDRSELSRLMQYVAAHQVEAAAKGRAATAYIQANFTWEHAVAKVRQRLEVLCRPQEKLQMNLTTLPDPLAQVKAAQASGNWQQAVDLLKSALAESAPLWNQLGCCYFQAGQLVEAEAAFNTGLELAPESLDILNNLAELYLQQEQFDQATEYLNRALQINPNDVNILLSLGNCCIQLNVFDTALMAFQRVQALAPETEGINEVINQLELMEVGALEAVL